MEDNNNNNNINNNNNNNYNDNYLDFSLNSHDISLSIKPLIRSYGI